MDGKTMMQDKTTEDPPVESRRPYPYDRERGTLLGIATEALAWIAALAAWVFIWYLISKTRA